MSDFDDAFTELEDFHHRNGTVVVYRPQIVTQRSRTGRNIGPTTTAPETIEVTVLIDFEVNLERVTSFGDPSLFRPGRQAIFRVLASDLEPQKDGRFEFDGKHYDVLGITPLWRGGTLFKYDVLVGLK